jgi:hypothetical protein
MEVVIACLAGSFVLTMLVFCGGKLLSSIASSKDSQ